MLDAKFNFWIFVVEVVLVLFGVLFWFSDQFAHNLGVSGFTSRFLAGIICLILATIFYFISTR